MENMMQDARHHTRYAMDDLRPATIVRPAFA